MLPDELPSVWEAFLKAMLKRTNPLRPAQYLVLETVDSPEFRRALLTDPELRKLFAMAEGGRILVTPGKQPLLKQRLRELGYFIDSF